MSSEDRNATVLLRKPCLDITMWAGYDPKDSQKNLEYYKTWNKRFVASAEHGNNTVDDIYNKYQARLLIAAVTVCSGLRCLVLSISH